MLQWHHLAFSNNNMIITIVLVTPSAWFYSCVQNSKLGYDHMTPHCQGEKKKKDSPVSIWLLSARKEKKKKLPSLRLLLNSNLIFLKKPDISWMDNFKKYCTFRLCIDLHLKFIFILRLYWYQLGRKRLLALQHRWKTLIYVRQIKCWAIN